MSALRVLFFVALAIACVFAAEERVKKQVLLGASPYAYSAYSGYSAPIAYSAPAAISAYGAYPAAYPSAYSAGLYGRYNGLYY